MSTWRFSDGTTAELGGTIEGDSLFAQELRAALEQPEILVLVGRVPSGGVRLDKNDPALFDAWLQQEAELPDRVKARIRITERPDSIPALPTLDTSDLDAWVAGLTPEQRETLVY